MRIGISVACLGRRDAGPETYERELIAHLAKIENGFEYRIFCFSPAARRAVPVDNDRVVSQVLWPGYRPVSLALSLPLALSFSAVELYHATFAPAPFPTKPMVLTMHDVSPFTHPHFYPADIRRRLTSLVARGLKQARMIICVSEHCRATTQELFGISSDRLIVVPHGVTDRFQPMDRTAAQSIVQQRFNLSEPYVLYVGKLEARKNISRLLRAFHRYREETGRTHKLVLAGRRFWDLENFDSTIAELGLAQDVVELGYIPDDALLPLYCAADLFLFPSLWEGFGFPVVEAMKSGVPVITSNCSCLPEVAGDAAVLVNPEAVEEIADAIGRVLGDSDKRRQMVQKGLAQASRFSWAAAAAGTVEAYERARC